MENCAVPEKGEGGAEFGVGVHGDGVVVEFGFEVVVGGRVGMGVWGVEDDGYVGVVAGAVDDVVDVV